MYGRKTWTLTKENERKDREGWRIIVSQRRPTKGCRATKSERKSQLDLRSAFQCCSQSIERFRYAAEEYCSYVVYRFG